jgi:hypothetical protein
MAKITRRSDQFFFPLACVNCRAPTEWACPINVCRGWDLLFVGGWECIVVAVPVCDACRARRVRGGRIALAAVVIVVGLLIGMIRMFFRSALASVGGAIVLVSTAGLVATVWYARNRMNRDLDRALLGVCGAGINPATNEATLWFRDPPALGENAGHAATVGYAELAKEEGRSVEMLIAPHRTPALAVLEAEDVRLQVRLRPVVIAAGALALASTTHLLLSGQVLVEPNHRGGFDLPLWPTMALTAVMLLGLGGLSVIMTGDGIVRSFWGLRKTLDRRTTVIRKHASNGLHLIDARGTRLWVTKYVANFDRLRAECRLRTDVLAAPATGAGAPAR